MIDFSSSLHAMTHHCGTGCLECLVTEPFWAKGSFLPTAAWVNSLSQLVLRCGNLWNLALLNPNSSISFNRRGP